LGKGVTVVITKAAATVTEIALVVVADALSVTRTVKLEVPDALGVPPRTPALFRVRPEGSVPLARLHV
jgi:hypothetical protein